MKKVKKKSILPVNSIEIIAPEKNLKKQVDIYDSGDGKPWESLPWDFIYDFSAQVNLRKTKMKLPVIKYTFFKLHLCNAQKLKNIDNKGNIM